MPPPCSIPGHVSMLHGFSSIILSPSHCLPSFAGAGLSHLLTERFVPPPHFLLQTVRSDQRPQPPSTGNCRISQSENEIRISRQFLPQGGPELALVDEKTRQIERVVHIMRL